jgi:protein-S-isoprenylcysteine O-methyltransferase Ste14
MATTSPRADRRGTLVLVAGIATYTAFGAAFGYFLLWFGGGAVPHLHDLGLPGPAAAATNLAVVVIFGATHSVMARPPFKRWITTRLAPSLERSVFVLTSSLTLALLTWAWQPLHAIAWDTHGWLRGALLAVYSAGVGLIFWVSFLLDHLHLTGVAQTWARFRGRHAPDPSLRTRSLYRWVRHPMNTGLLVICWSVPTMSAARLQAALLLTAYILIGQALEERDLRRAHGAAYDDYAAEVPALVPALRR